MCRKMLWLILLALLLGSAAVQGAQIEWIRAAYWDGRYGTAWLNAAAGTAIRDGLAAAGYEILDADQLKTWMDARIADGKYSVVVFCRDRVPDTVTETTDTNCTLRTYLNKGGKIVWISDIPFYYRGTADGGSTTPGDGGAPAVLGFNTAGATRDTYQTVTLTPVGQRWGLTQTWQSRRPALPTVTTNLTILATDNAGNAAAWMKPYVAGDKFRGFVRIWDVDVTTTARPTVEEIIRVAEFTGAKAWVVSPPNGARGWMSPMLDWESSFLPIKQHIVYVGTTRELTAANRHGQPLPPIVSSSVYMGLQAGTTYYWRVDEIGTDNTVYEGDVWSFSTPPAAAWEPSPADGQKFVVANVTLTWNAGMDAFQHDVYLGTDRAKVEAGDPSVLKAPGLWDASYQATGLEGSQTYYWRVDETDAAGLVPGDVWSFTTRPAMTKVANLVGWWKLEDEGTGTAVDYSGWGRDGTITGTPQFVNGFQREALNTSSCYVRVETVGITGAAARTIAGWAKSNTTDPADWVDVFGFTGPSAANNHFDIECVGPVAGSTTANYYGLHRHNWERDIMPVDLEWHHLAATFDGTTVSWYGDGALVGSATGLTIATPGPVHIGKRQDNANYFQGIVDDVRVYDRALSEAEIKALMLPDTTLPSNPSPADAAVVSIHEALALNWTGGSGAAQHDVYLGTDRMAVKTADTTSPEYKGRQPGTTFNTSALVDMNDTYYWRIDEVSAAGAVSKGIAWSFSIPDYIPIDDIQGYTENYENLGCIYQTWIDGAGFTTPVDTPGNGSGAAVGHPTWDAASAYYNLTTVETGYVHLGSTQSMPLYYFNGGPKSYSEAVRTWTMPQNFTGYGVTDLSLWVHGFLQAPQSITVTENPAGSMSLTGDGEDIWMSRDEFTFAYKTLIGDGSLVARVVSNGTGTNTWAKGGVMIRQSLDGFSAHAMTAITGSAGNGAAFQRRRVYADNVSSPSENTEATAAVAPPYWVKIERFGSEFHGSISPDNVTWTELAVDPPVTAAMTDPVLIGLCVTSHVRGEYRTYQFDNIKSTGTVTGQWQGAVIESPMSNKPGSMYVTLTDSMGRSQTVQDTDTDRVNSLRWSEWQIPLSSLTSVDPTRIKKMAVGVDNRANPAAGGNGLMFIDDIRAIKPTPTIAPADSLVADAAGMILSINGLEVSKLVLGTTTFPSVPGTADPNSQAVKADDFDLNNAASDGTQPYMDVRFAVPVKAILLVESHGNDSGYFQALDIDGMPTGQMAPYMAWFDYLRTEYRFFTSQQACGIVFTPPSPVYGIRIKGTGTTVGFDALSVSGVPAQ